MSGAHPIGALAWTSLVSPAAAARAVLARVPGRDVLWSALGLVSILSAFLYYFRGLVAPMPPMEVPTPDGATLSVTLTPMALAFTIFALLTVLVFVLAQVGRLLGGKGDIGPVLLAVAWTQAVFLILDLAFLSVTFLAPALAGFAALLTLAVMLRSSVHFLNVAQHFGSLPRAAATLLLSVLGLATGLGVILGLIISAVLTMGAAL